MEMEQYLKKSFFKALIKIIIFKFFIIAYKKMYPNNLKIEQEVDKIIASVDLN